MIHLPDLSERPANLLGSTALGCRSLIRMRSTAPNRNDWFGAMSIFASHGSYLPGIVCGSVLMSWVTASCACPERIC
jgi:hypothetical protein